MTREAVTHAKPATAGLRLFARLRSAATRLVELVRRLESSTSVALDRSRCRGSDPPTPGGCC